VKNSNKFFSLLHPAIKNYLGQSIDEETSRSRSVYGNEFSDTLKRPSWQKKMQGTETI